MQNHTDGMSTEVTATTRSSIPRSFSARRPRSTTTTIRRSRKAGWARGRS